MGNEVLRVVDDRRLVAAVPLRDRAVSSFIHYVIYNTLYVYVIWPRGVRVYICPDYMHLHVRSLL